MRARMVVVAAGAALAAACSTESNIPLAPQAVGPLAEIVDGGHGGGNQSFFWLPPIVLGSSDGANVAGLAPVVKIFECSGSSCSDLGATVAEFTTGTDLGSETVRDGGDHYIVNWHTDRGSDDGVVPGETYRVCVSVGDINLGHADVLVGSNGKDVKDARANGQVPLVDGSTLPIKFRIEQDYQGGGSDDGCGGAAPPATLSGDVTLDGNPPPVPPLVFVSLWKLSGEPVSGGITTADGHYQLPDTDPGSYQVCAAPLPNPPDPYNPAPWNLAGSITCPNGALGFNITLVSGANVQDFAFTTP